LIILVKYRETSDSGGANGRVLISVVLEVVDDPNKVVYARDNRANKGDVCALHLDGDVMECLQNEKVLIEKYESEKYINVHRGEVTAPRE
jgi:hypothetical protein